VDPIGAAIRLLDERWPAAARRLEWRHERGDDLAMKVVDALVPRGATVLDIGALFGTFTVRMLDLVGRDGVVHAFEPNPLHRDRLLRLPGQGRRLIVHPLALSDHDGQAELNIPTEGGLRNAGLASLEDRGELPTRAATVDVRRLDDVIASGPRVSFVKCDVEGHEDAVIAGGAALIERDKPALLVEIEQRHRSADVTVAFDRLTGFGYEGWALFPAGVRPLSEFDLERDQLARLSQRQGGGVALSGYVHNFLFAVPGTNLGRLR
jgi:FkbM family methyltransferase